MNRLYIKKSTINNIGLYTNKSLTIGQHVAYIHGTIHVFRSMTKEISNDTLNWIGAGKYSWIDTDNSLFRFINHSCDPNVAQITKRKVIAIKDIPADTEITMDYSLTEAESDWKIIDCTCGAANCRGTITAIMHLPKKVYKKREQYIPKNFRHIFETYK